MNTLNELKKAQQEANAAREAWWAACEAYDQADTANAGSLTLHMLANAMDSTQVTYLGAASRLQTVLAFYLEEVA